MAEQGLRARKKLETRARISDAVIDLLLEGELDIGHDSVAERTGIARRTVYRYFADRETMIAAADARVRELAGARVNHPDSEADLLDTVEDVYVGFDRIAAVITLLKSTPQGRALRLSQNALRVDSYTAATADLVGQLPEADRRLATAMLQVIHTTVWLEMRDHWGLSGHEIGRAAAWAIRALIADLRQRGPRGLDAPLDTPQPPAA